MITWHNVIICFPMWSFLTVYTCWMNISHVSDALSPVTVIFLFPILLSVRSESFFSYLCLLFVFVSSQWRDLLQLNLHRSEWRQRCDLWTNQGNPEHRHRQTKGHQVQGKVTSPCRVVEYLQNPDEISCIS